MSAKSFLQQLAKEVTEVGDAIADVVDGAIFDAKPAADVIPEEPPETEDNEPVTKRKPGSTFRAATKASKSKSEPDKSDPDKSEPDKSEPDKPAA